MTGSFPAVASAHTATGSPQLTTSNAKKNLSSTFEEQCDSQQKPRIRQQRTVAEQFVHTPDELYIIARLTCTSCTTAHRQSTFNLDIPSETEKKNLLGTTWFRGSYVSSFLQLVSHKYHSPDVHLMVVDTPAQSDPILPIAIIGKKLVVSALQGFHFALLEFVLEDKMIIVHDGFGYSLTHWFDHAKFALKKASLIPLDYSSRRIISVVDNMTDNTSPRHEWGMKKGDWVPQQTDTYNCGPLCCAAGWQLLSGGQGIESGLTPDIYRQRVIHQFQEYLKEFDSSLFCGHGVPPRKEIK